MTGNFTDMVFFSMLAAYNNMTDWGSQGSMRPMSQAFEIAMEGTGLSNASMLKPWFDVIVPVDIKSRYVEQQPVVSPSNWQRRLLQMQAALAGGTAAYGLYIPYPESTSILPGSLAPFWLATVKSSGGAGTATSTRKEWRPAQYMQVVPSPLATGATTDMTLTTISIRITRDMVLQSGFRVVVAVFAVSDPLPAGSRQSPGPIFLPTSPAPAPAPTPDDSGGDTPQPFSTEAPVPETTPAQAKAGEQLPAWAIALIIIFPSVSLIVILSVYFAVVQPRRVKKAAATAASDLAQSTSMSRHKLGIPDRETAQMNRAEHGEASRRQTDLRDMFQSAGTAVLQRKK
jgi:hypothetical protein